MFYLNVRLCSLFPFGEKIFILADSSFGFRSQIESRNKTLIWQIEIIIIILNMPFPHFVMWLRLRLVNSRVGFQAYQFVGTIIAPVILRVKRSSRDILFILSHFVKLQKAHFGTFHKRLFHYVPLPVEYPVFIDPRVAPLNFRVASKSQFQNFSLSQGWNGKNTRGQKCREAGATVKMNVTQM